MAQVWGSGRRSTLAKSVAGMQIIGCSGARVGGVEEVEEAVLLPEEWRLDDRTLPPLQHAMHSESASGRTARSSESGALGANLNNSAQVLHEGLL